MVLIAPAPLAPVGVAHEFQGVLSHAYDNDEINDHSTGLVLTYTEARRQVLERDSQAGEAARIAWPR